MQIKTTSLAEYQDNPQVDHYVLTEELAASLMRSKLWKVTQIVTNHEGTTVHMERGDKRDGTYESASCPKASIEGCLFQLTKRA